MRRGKFAALLTTIPDLSVGVRVKETTIVPVAKESGKSDSGTEISHRESSDFPFSDTPEFMNHKKNSYGNYMGLEEINRKRLVPATLSVPSVCR